MLCSQVKAEIDPVLVNSYKLKRKEELLQLILLESCRKR